MAKQERIQINEQQQISKRHHDALVEYIKVRLDWANELREPMVDRLRQIDRDVHGHLVLSTDDRKRSRDNARGHGVKPVDSILPLTLVQMDEAVTIAMGMLAPDEGMYQALASNEQQPIAKAFTALMNKHAEWFSHYTHLAKGIGSAFKFNLGGWEINWQEITGRKVTNDAAGNPVVVDDIVSAGNEFKFLSMYNTLWDPSVEPYEVNEKGEFYATVQMVMPFRMHKMEQDGELFGTERFLQHGQAGSRTYATTYYEEPPVISNVYTSEAVQIPNWTEILTGNSEKMGQAVELVNVPIWIRPQSFGLGNSKEFEIWRISLANGKYIVKAIPLTNAHSMLPCVFTRPLDDDLGSNAKSYGEMLTPFNRFSSFQMNLHQQAARRSLYGLTFYLKNKVPSLANMETDMVAGKIPVDDSIDDIRKAVLQIFDAPDTQNTLRDIDFMDSLMQKILPTDLLKQVTDLERATRYQAAATVQGSNRRSLKIARIINAQALSKARTMQMYNIFEFQRVAEVITPDGELQTVTPRDFRDAGLEFVVSDGLKGLDKLTLTEGLKEVLTMVVQNQAASQQFDVPAIINYWTSLLGDRTDFSQFRIRSAIDALPPEQKDLAFQLLQQALQAEEGGEQPAAGGLPA